MAKKNVQWLIENMKLPNMVDRLDKEMVTKIAERCLNGYDVDINSRLDWEKKTKAGIEVAKQITKAKTFPWKDAANVKFPLIAQASIQFASRCYPQIVKGTDVVKAMVVGEDRDGKKTARAKRISQHMSYQCLEQMPEWDPDMDQLLHGLPVMGTYFKKTYFDSLLERNRSICCTPLDVVVNMKHKGDLTTCRRISHKLWLYRNEVIERSNNGIFVEDAVKCMVDYNPEEDMQELFIEQHCWYDCDGDGYEEPYIVTTHYNNRCIVRVVANYDRETLKLRNDKIRKIEKIEYFTKFGFIPDPEGDFYDVGFSQLLGPINESMSTLINQLLDAGSLSNMQSGFISKGLRWSGGRLEFDLGEWKPVDTVGMSLKDSILPLPVREPSMVLFQLLGLLNDTGQKLASVSDAMSGEQPSQNTPATTTLAMIEQGLKVFSAIYKRVYRSLALEFKKMYRLNGLYLDDTEYYRVLDSQFAIARVDYELSDMDVIPVADPQMASEAQRLAIANALMQTLPMNPDPMAQAEILRQYYEAIGAKNIEILINMENIKKAMDNPPPNPELVKAQLEIQKAQDAMEVKLKELELTENEIIAKIQNIEADTNLKIAQGMKALADAEAVEPGTQIQMYRAFMDDLKAQQAHEREMKKLSIEKETDAEEGEAGGGAPPEGGMSGTPEGSVAGADAGMAPAPNNNLGAEQIAGTPAGTVGPTVGGTNLDSVLSGTNGDADYAGVGENLRSEFNSGIEPGSGG